MSGIFETIKTRDSASYCNLCVCNPKNECMELVEKNKYEIQNSTKAICTSINTLIRGKLYNTRKFSLYIMNGKRVGGIDTYDLIIKSNEGRLSECIKIRLTAECCSLMRSILFQRSLLKELRKARGYKLEMGVYDDDTIDYEDTLNIQPFPTRLKNAETYLIGEFVKKLN